MQPEAVGVGCQARVGAAAGIFAAQGLADVLDVHAGGQPLYRFVDAFEYRFLKAFFLDVVEK